MVARRYAEALYQEAEDGGKVDRVDADMTVVRDTLSSSRELRIMFASPIVSQEKKQSVAAKLFGGRVDPLVARLVSVMISKGRETLLEETARSYGELRDQHSGVVEAHVRTALPLEQAEVGKLQTALEQVTGRSVRLRIDVEPDLLAGLVVRIGDTVYDGTARHQLKTLREQFAMRTYLSN
jgi:F-type H+-transporting ATPase subunit delta